jgi:hypothetical protein
MWGPAMTTSGAGMELGSPRLGVWWRGGQIEANKRARELAWELRRLSRGLDGGEHERGALAPAAATMAAGRFGVARGGARGGFK